MNKSFAKLRWDCRRGMLELDLLLLPFLEKVFATLSVEEQATFEKLLACTDQDLYGWLIGHEQPVDPALANMVNRVRSGA
jgi:antitoxin CptB